MPFDESGTFNPLVTFVPNTPATAEDQNTQDLDFAAGLTDCLTRDGLAPATANLNVGGFRILQVANAVDGSDAVNLTQAQALVTLNPLRFGAKGDGVTDDTAALQTTINFAGALLTSGYAVIDCRGLTYAVSAPLNAVSHVALKNFAFVALASVSWTTSNGVITIGSSISFFQVWNCFIDCALQAQCGIYNASRVAIALIDPWVRRFLHAGVKNSGSMWLVKPILEQFNGSDNSYDNPANRTGYSYYATSTASDTHFIGGTLSRALSPIRADAGAKTHRFIGTHVWNGTTSGVGPVVGALLSDLTDTTGFAFIGCYHDSGTHKITVSTATGVDISFQGGFTVYNGAAATLASWLSLVTSAASTTFTNLKLDPSINWKGNIPILAMSVTGAGAWTSTTFAATPLRDMMIVRDPFTIISSDTAGNQVAEFASSSAASLSLARFRDPSTTVAPEFGSNGNNAVIRASGAVVATAVAGTTAVSGWQVTRQLFLGQYTYGGLAALTPQVGSTVYVTNGRAFNGAGTMEGAGSGTGVGAQWNGTDWKVLGTNVTVLA